MKAAEQRKTDFIQELRQLCFKHKCELYLTDDGEPYGQHSPILVLSFEGVYGGSNETIAEFGRFELDNIWFPSSEATKHQGGTK